MNPTEPASAPRAPSEPASPSGLRSLAPGVWCADAQASLGAGVALPIRMTIVRLPDGTLWVHSPIRLTDELVAELRKLGPVAHLVSPNLFHHLFLEQAAQRFPQARVWAPAGLEKKQKTLRIDAHLDATLDWEGAFAALPIEGARSMSEWVFLHRPTGTLIVTDLVFNLDDSHRGVTRLVLRWTGTFDRLARSRVWSLLVRDRGAFGASLRRVLDLDFERVVPAHGAVIDADAKAAMTEVLARDVDRGA
jgi:hypothetical protein